MKGRKPIPLELHHLKGLPGKRPMPDPLPVPKGRPECPEHFDADARKDWDHACDLVEQMGILSKADRVAMEMFVDTYARWKRACRNADLYGEVQCLDKDKRIFVINPYMKLRNQLWSQLHDLLGDFGLTPVARTRLKTTGENREDDDPLLAMMAARAGRN